MLRREPVRPGIRFLVSRRIAAMWIAAGVTSCAHATIWSVDAREACSNTGPGTADAPLCTIGAGAIRAVAGDTVRVAPGLYREQVAPIASGDPGAPILFEAAEPGAIVMGSIDVSGGALWTPTDTTAWRRIFSPAPKQIWVDGERLTPGSVFIPTTTGTWSYDVRTQTLYVDIGGSNPGEKHSVEAGVRSFGFTMQGLSNITILGFRTKYQSSAGVRISNSSGITLHGVEAVSSGGNGIRVELTTGPVTVEDCTVSESGSVGIALSTASGVTLRRNVSHHNGFHGIGLQISPNNLIEGNICYANARPGVRSAVGIDVNGGSSGTTVRMNTTYANQDSGINVYNGSHNTLVVRNVSFDNGDHGFDTLGSTGVSYVSNTCFHNTNDGFSVEGNSSNASLFDNISVDNGVATNHHDLYVDGPSFIGFVSDWNLIWNESGAASIKANGITYSSLSSYRGAAHQEGHGLSADPRFVDVDERDLHLAAGSPAIDSASSRIADFSLVDRDGGPLYDDPIVRDSGDGTPKFADRGAYERPDPTRTEQPPIARLSVNPPSGLIPLNVTADASASTDVDATPIASYIFDFGDGTLVGPQPQPIATHVYQVEGSYEIVVTVSDTNATSSTASAPVIARDNPPTARLSASPTSGFVNLTVSANASQSTDSDSTPIAGYAFDFGDGTTVGPQTNPIANHTYTAGGIYRLTLTVSDSAGKSSSVFTTITVRDDPPHAMLRVTGTSPTFTFDATGSRDTDATPIASYAFDFKDGTVVGPQASPTAVHTYTAPGDYRPEVIVTDTAGNVGRASGHAKVH